MKMNWNFQGRYALPACASVRCIDVMKEMIEDVGSSAYKHALAKWIVVERDEFGKIVGGLPEEGTPCVTYSGKSYFDDEEDYKICVYRKGEFLFNGIDGVIKNDVIAWKPFCYYEDEKVHKL